MNPIYDSVHWGGVPIRGTLILSRRHSKVGWPVPFFAAFNCLSVATRCPFAAGWTVSEHPNYDPRVRLEPSMFCSAVKRSNHLAALTTISYNCSSSVLKFFQVHNLQRAATAPNTVTILKIRLYLYLRLSKLLYIKMTCHI